MDEEDDRKVTGLPIEKNDRVMNLADDLCKVLTRSYEVNLPEEHLAALYLVEAAVHHIVVQKYGLEALESALVKANRMRKSYGFNLVPDKIVYDEEEQPAPAEVLPFRRKDDSEDQG